MRKLKAILAVLQSFAKNLHDHIIKWFTDNQNVVHIVQVGSKKPHLQEGTMSIFQMCLQYCIKLQSSQIMLVR